jgi:L-threonylcarbamoyladenylate synthase
MIFDEDIINAAKTLKEGGIILYPTDTVWGLGCDPTNDSAVEKIFKVKKRKENNSLVLLVDCKSMLQQYVRDIPEIAFELIEASDKPLTIIYPKGKNLSPGVCSENGSIGIRICMDEFCRNLIRVFHKPIVSTSANISGQPAPVNFNEIAEVIINSVNFVVKHRQNDRGKHSPSPIIRVEQNGEIKIIRR